jgi:ubiquinone/menaquinone biosynthesis C-methylase UbiE
MTSERNRNNSSLVNGNALQLPFANNSFNLIIIQDVIEHLTDVTDFYSEIKRILKTNGSIYLSTPNKHSIFNFITDPHFGLPIVSVLKRESIKKYFLKYFRKDDYNRTDIAQLYSLNEILNLFKKDFEILLQTNFSVQELFNDNNGIVWSNFHLKLIAFCKRIKLDWLLIKISNDKSGIINKYFTPTFYFVLKK